MAAQGFHHLLIIEFRVVIHSRFNGHDKTGSAESALHRIFLYEGLLDRMELTWFSDPFYCSNFPAIGLYTEDQAAAQLPWPVSGSGKVRPSGI